MCLRLLCVLFVAAAVAACGAPQSISSTGHGEGTAHDGESGAAANDEAAVEPLLEPGEVAVSTHHGGMQHDFSDIDHWVARFEGPERDAWQLPDATVALLAIEPGMTVADVGAGTGYFEGRLSAAVGASGRVLALDVEPMMVEHIAQRAAAEGWLNVETRQIPYDEPGLDAASVDRVLIVNTWHHIGDRVEYSAALAAALRPGGAVYIVDFTLESEHGPPAEHRISAEAVAAELEAGGLVAEILAEELPAQYVVVGRAP